MSATNRPPGLKQLKRTYASARTHYNHLQSALSGLKGTQTYLPPGVLVPAIDLLYDAVEAARAPYREAAEACLARGIKRVQGQCIPTHWHVDDLDSDEIDKG